mmetsp:Transcript_58122/g.52351  ORF Transcript_58122/g.52351 Transcript_58122/m.52351 type:complete len:272 (+) Transcript_58122:71-886(+)
MNSIARMGINMMRYSPYIAYSCAFLIRPQYLSVYRRQMHYKRNPLPTNSPLFINAQYRNLAQQSSNNPSNNTTDSNSPENKQPFIDHYQTLHLQPNADIYDIRANFWKLYWYHQFYTSDQEPMCMFYTPYKTEEEWSKIQFLLRDYRTAKSILLDEQQRTQFDKMRTDYYKSIEKEEYIDQLPAKNNVIDTIHIEKGLGTWNGIFTSWGKSLLWSFGICLVRPIIFCVVAGIGYTIGLFVRGIEGIGKLIKGSQRSDIKRKVMRQDHIQIA